MEKNIQQFTINANNEKRKGRAKVRCTFEPVCVIAVYYFYCLVLEFQALSKIYKGEINETSFV